jgi:tyrosinase
MKDQLKSEKGLFMHFHRYFIWLYERALREECGYKSTQPYWDWTIDWEDPRKSTVFDGSPTSLGSNGKAIPHGNTTLNAFGISLETGPGTGGGCVESGPFSNYTLNLGPNAFTPLGPNNGLGPNPRCLSRDISLYWSNQTKPTDVQRLLSGCTDLGCFGTAIEALDGVHTAGHLTIGGIAMDAYASASDPAFYLHHASVDRMWSIWQGLNPQNRTNQVYGTSTAFNGESLFHMFRLAKDPLC